MSNVSIFNREWIDLVFEGKNKEYGAYELRKNSSKTTSLAFFCSLGTIASIVAIASVFSSHTPNPDPINPTVLDSLLIVSVDPRIFEKEKQEQISKPKGAEIENKNKKPVVVEHTQATDPVFINNELPKNPEPSNPDGGNGTGTEIGPSTGGGTEVNNVPKIPTNEIVSSVALDEMPEFPGGIKKFYTKVADSFERLDIENVESVSVIVSFVVERDGSMTDIKVLRNSGYGIDKAAINVLQNMKTKWKAGVKNGQKVRTQYTLPITVKLNE
jgi:protein TonB